MNEVFVQLGDGPRVTSQKLHNRAARAATGLAARGVGPGSTVALLLRNDVAFIEAMLALGRLGAYAVPLNWSRGDRVLAHVLGDSGTTHVVAHEDLARSRSALLDGRHVIRVATPRPVALAYGLDLDSDQPAEWEDLIAAHEPATRRVPAPGSIFYTSGSTGLPKGVQRAPLSAEGRERMGKLRREWFGAEPGMRTVICGPLYHSVQTSYLLAGLGAGGAVRILPRFDARAVLETIDAMQITHLHLVPAMIRRLLRLPVEVRERYDVGSLKFVIHGAAPCPADDKARLIEWFGPIVHEYYGTTEVGMISRATSREWLERPGTVGRPLQGRFVRILDPDGHPLPPGKVGTVYASGGSMPEFTYRNAPESRAQIEREGAVTNGDLGYLDNSGYLFLAGRTADLILCGGANLYPAEIEAELAGMAGVDDCVAFGIPDPDLGEVVALAVRLGGPQSPDEAAILDYLRPRVSPHELPRKILFVEHLPRDPAGKVFRQVLRDAHS